jgi:hypothetical protein
MTGNVPIDGTRVAIVGLLLAVLLAGTALFVLHLR